MRVRGATRWSRRWLGALAVVMLAGCATTSPTGSPGPSAVPASAVAGGSPAVRASTEPPGATASTPTASPSPAPLGTSRDLIANPPVPGDPATLTFTSRQTEHLFRNGCMAVWGKPTAKEQAVDRAAACLGAIALVYYRYVDSDGRAEANFEQARQMYAEALTVLDAAGKAYVDSALVGLDAAITAAPAKATPGKQTLKHLSATGALGPLTFHKRVAKAFADNLGAILVACPGFDYPGVGIPACFPYPLYQPERNRDADQVTKRVVGLVAACEYSPRVGSVRPDVTIHNCGQAAVGLWTAYRVTGDRVYWDLLGSLTSMVAAKGDGKYAATEVAEFARCYSSWVLSPGTSDSCPD